MRNLAKLAGWKSVCVPNAIQKHICCSLSLLYFLFVYVTVLYQLFMLCPSEFGSM